MCRWLAYSGSPVLLDDLLFRPDHSLIDQSLRSRLGATTTNGDGFGVGWYGAEETPAVFRSVEPAWNDRNLRNLSRHLSSRLVFAHIRASTGSPIQHTNCHPFCHGRWLWMHNGAIRAFDTVKRDLAFAVDPSLYAAIQGSLADYSMQVTVEFIPYQAEPPAPETESDGTQDDQQDPEEE